MKDVHLAQVGYLFNSPDQIEFFSNQNINEYDFIIIDTDELLKSIQNKPLSHVQDRFTQLLEFVSTKNLPIVFISFNVEFYRSLSTKSFTLYNLLNLDVVAEATQGQKMEFNRDNMFGDLMMKYSDAFKYNVCFSKHPGDSLGKAKDRTLSIGFHTKDFVFLPCFNNNVTVDEATFFEDLYKVCRTLRLEGELPKLPEWTSDYYLPGEKEEEERTHELQKQIKELEDAKKESELRKSSYVELKQLWTATGSQLEDVVKKVFVELGFTLLPAEARRDDIIMELNGQVVIVEVKGQNKSAAEKNAAQLEKWVSTYMADHDGVTPKGILIVNTFRELPLEDRNLPSFPNQMLPYSKNRSHCLLTTLQLCSLLLFCRANSQGRNGAIERLLSTIGVFEQFENWSDSISVKNIKPPKPQLEMSKEILLP
jgi:hypothetical protein